MKFSAKEVKLALATFASSLAASPLVAALMGGHVNVAVSAVVSTLVTAAVAVVHRFVKE